MFKALKKKVSNQPSPNHVPNAHDKLKAYVKENNVPDLKSGKVPKDYMQGESGAGRRCFKKKHAGIVLLCGLAIIAGGIVANMFIKGDQESATSGSLLSGTNSTTSTPAPTQKPTSSPAPTLPPVDNSTATNATTEIATPVPTTPVPTCNPVTYTSYSSVYNFACGAPFSVLDVTTNTVFSADDSVLAASAVSTTTTGTQSAVSSLYLEYYRQWPVSSNIGAIQPGYSIPVSQAGNYLVSMYFVNSGASNGLFSVLVQNSVAISSLNLAALSGVYNVNATATVDASKTLTIDFVTGDVSSYALINALQVFSVSTAISTCP